MIAVQMGQTARVLGRVLSDNLSVAFQFLPILWPIALCTNKLHCRSKPAPGYLDQVGPGRPIVQRTGKWQSHNVPVPIGTWEGNRAMHSGRQSQERPHCRSKPAPIGTRAADRTVGLPSMRVLTPYKRIILHDLLHITLVTYCNTMGFMTTIHHTATRASKVFIWGYALAVECMRVDG